MPSESKNPRIVYMGTPEFAVPPLEALIKERYQIVGVVRLQTNLRVAEETSRKVRLNNVLVSMI